MGFAYRMMIEWSEADQVYVARVPAFPGCAAHGDTEADAAAEVRIAAEGMIEVMRELGRDVPPADVAVDYSGRLLVRMPKSLHADLARQAEAEDVSLNQWVVTRLASSRKAPEVRIVHRRRVDIPAHAKAEALDSAKKKSVLHRKGR